MSFINDLKAGQRAEGTVITLLAESPELLAGLLEVSRPTGKFSDYDFKLSASFEIKNDKYESDNFCFETHNPKTGKLTGVMKSLSNYIIYINEDVVVIFDRVVLIEKDLIEAEHKPKSKYRALKKMGDGNAAGLLIDKQYCVEKFKSVVFFKYFN